MHRNSFKLSETPDFTFGKRNLSDVLNLVFTFDIGHDYCIGNKDFGFIKKRIDRFSHMHVYDAVGKKNHLSLGSGEIDIKEKLEMAAKCDCRCVLDIKTIEGLRESVRYVRNLPEFSYE